MKTLTAILMLLAAVALGAPGLTTPIRNGRLDSALNGNGQGITNLGAIAATNFIDATTGLPLSTGGGGGITAPQVGAIVAGSNYMTATTTAIQIGSSNLQSALGFIPLTPLQSTNSVGTVVAGSNYMTAAMTGVQIGSSNLQPALGFTPLTPLQSTNAIGTVVAGSNYMTAALTAAQIASSNLQARLGYTPLSNGQSSVTFGGILTVTGAVTGLAIVRDVGAEVDLQVGVNTNLTVNAPISALGFSGDGSGLTGLNASSLSSGTVADARLYGAHIQSTNIQFSGTAGPGGFTNSAAYFAVLDAGTNLDALAPGGSINSGLVLLSNLTALSVTSSGGSNVFVGTVDIQSELRTTNSAGTAGQVLTSGGAGAGPYWSTAAGGAFNPSASNAYNGTFTGNGAGATNLNASELRSGTVPDGRLGTNVPLLSAVNYWGNNNEWAGSVQFDGGVVMTNTLSIGARLKIGTPNATTDVTNQFELDTTAGVKAFVVGTNGVAYGNGAGMTNLNVSSLPGSVATNTGDNKFAANQTVTGNVTVSGQFNGNGAGVTNVPNNSWNQPSTFLGQKSFMGSTIYPGISTTEGAINANVPNGQGSATAVAPTATRPTHIKRSATATLFGFIATANNYHNAWDFDASWVVELGDTNNACRYWFNLSAAGPQSTDTPSDAVGFRFSSGTSDVNWMGYKEDGSNATTNTGVAVALNTTYALAVSKRGTTVTYYINGANVGAMTWNPSAATIGVNAIGNILSGSDTHSIHFYGFNFKTPMP